MGLLDDVRARYERDGLDGLWRWAMAPKGAHSKAKRFACLERFAEKKRDSARGDERKKWADARKVYAEQRDKYEERYEARQAVKWPANLPITEILYHNPPHFHLASSDRSALIAVCKVIQAEFNCRIGEFPPFDTVENVHTGSSWHYRDPSRPYVGVAFNASKLQQGGPWGLAADINDLDGGSDQEYAAYIEVKRRYA